MPSKFIDLNLIRRYDAIVNEKIETAMQNSGGDTIPIGTIFEFPTDDSSKLPTGYLFCDGSAISRTTYSDLFGVIGTTFGSGDGSTTFNLPTKEGLVTVGKKSSDTDFDTIGETGGEKTHTLSVDEIPSHAHNMKWQNEGAGGGGLGTLMKAPWDTTQYSYPTVATGGGQAHNNLQPYTVSNYIIKASNSSPIQAEVVDSYSTSTTDAYSAHYVNNLNTYSTSEQRIGTWVNGKPIYRKVIAVDFPTNTLTIISYPHNISNIQMITDYRLVWYDTEDARWFNYFKDTTGTYVQIDGISNTQVRIKATGTAVNWNTRTTNKYAIIEYTKTTD